MLSTVIRSFRDADTEKIFKRPITAELALRLGRYFGQSPRYWLNLQSRYDMDVAEDELGKRVAREVRPFKAAA